MAPIPRRSHRWRAGGRSSRSTCSAISWSLRSRGLAASRRNACASRRRRSISVAPPLPPGLPTRCSRPMKRWRPGGEGPRAAVEAAAPDRAAARAMMPRAILAPMAAGGASLAEEIWALACERRQIAAFHGPIDPCSGLRRCRGGGVGTGFAGVTRARTDPAMPLSTVPSGTVKLNLHRG